MPKRTDPRTPIVVDSRGLAVSAVADVALCRRRVQVSSSRTWRRLDLARLAEWLGDAGAPR